LLLIKWSSQVLCHIKTVLVDLIGAGESLAGEIVC